MIEIASPNIWQIIWFAIITITMIAYYVLDGFDLGIGILYPFVGKTEEDKAVMRNVIGPLWDGNEVWLITAGGALFAAFPPAYATTFSGFYLAIMLVLFALIMRAVAIHFARAGSMEKLWDIAFFLGSAIPALLFGVAVGNLLNTIPLLANGDVAGAFPARFIQLLGVFPLLCGVLSLVMAILQGASWLALKAHPGDLRNSAIKIRSTMQIAVIVVMVLSSVAFFMIAAPNLTTAGGMIGGIAAILRYVFLALAVAGIVFALGKAKKDDDLGAFIGSSIFIAMVIALTTASLFPAIVPAGDPALAPLAAANEGISITAGAPFASSDLTLIAMSIIALIGVPLVFVYHVLVYRIFVGRIRHDEYDAYH